MIHWIVSIVIAGIAGLIASKLINKSGSGLLMDILLGVVGGFVGRFLIGLLPAVAAMTAQPGIMGFVIDVIIAAAGAALVIVIWNMVTRRGDAAS